MIDAVKFNTLGRGEYLVRRSPQEFIHAAGMLNPADQAILEKMVMSVVDACIEAVKNTPTDNCYTSHDVAMADSTIHRSIQTIKKTFDNGNQSK
jgi:hypothetical protein